MYKVRLYDDETDLVFGYASTEKIAEQMIKTASSLDGFEKFFYEYKEVIVDRIVVNDEEILFTPHGVINVDYINRIVDACTKAAPGQEMMFGGLGNLILYVTKDKDFVKGTDEFNMVDMSIYKKDGVLSGGKYKDLLIGDELGVHVTELYNKLLDIVKATKKLSVL